MDLGLSLRRSGELSLCKYKLQRCSSSLQGDKNHTSRSLSITEDPIIL